MTRTSGEKKELNQPVSVALKDGQDTLCLQELARTKRLQSTTHEMHQLRLGGDLLEMLDNRQVGPCMSISGTA